MFSSFIYASRRVLLYNILDFPFCEHIFSLLLDKSNGQEQGVFSVRFQLDQILI
jgi:hypothetical protein